MMLGLKGSIAQVSHPQYSTPFGLKTAAREMDAMGVKLK